MLKPIANIKELYTMYLTACVLWSHVFWQISYIILMESDIELGERKERVCYVEWMNVNWIIVVKSGNRVL